MCGLDRGMCERVLLGGRLVELSKRVAVTGEGSKGKQCNQKVVTREKFKLFRCVVRLADTLSAECEWK